MREFGFDEAVALIGGASSYADVVADFQSRAAVAAASGGAADPYKILVKLVHPDAVSATRSVTATDAFAKLSRLYAERDGSVWRLPGGRSYRVGRRLHTGAIADLLEVDRGAALLKVPRDPRDNDLMETEATALRQLWADGDPKYRAYAPRLLESFRHEDADRRRRCVNIVERLDGFVPLSRVSNLDPRDAAWMWRRLLTGLGWAHRAGVVHGAVFEEHVLIHPAEHGVALIDWCYSGAKPQVVIQGRDYPPEVTGAREAGPATDIYLATALMKRLIGARMPAAMRRFADGCLYDAPRMRPQDAWRLLAELDELLHHLYGPRTFRPFTLQEV